MENADGEAGFAGEALQFAFPEAYPGTVAAAFGGDGETLCLGMARFAEPLPPLRMLSSAKAAAPLLIPTLTRIGKSMERLLTAHQEDLLLLDQLRHRMPELRARERSMRAERQAIVNPHPIPNLVEIPFKPASNCSIACPSTPAAPLLDLVAL